MTEIWILGASGRTGRDVAANLAARGMPLVLLGRNASALAALAKTIDGKARVVVASSVDEIINALAKGKPAVVINTIEPFTETALPIVRGLAPGTHYLDLGNELPVYLALLELNDEFVEAGRCVVPGAAWGALATESVVLKLCQGRPPAARVRVDNVASVDQSGPMGQTLAATLASGIPYGSRCYRNGRLKRVAVGSGRERLSLPDGSIVETGSVPTGELEAARRASGASDAVAGFPGVTAQVVRALLPVFAALLTIPAIRALAVQRLARVKMSPSKRKTSWAHARVEWPDGSTREGWLRAGDANAFLVKAAAEVAIRLARGEGRPGAFTPGALFGTELAVQAGGEFVFNQAPANEGADR